MAVDHGLQGRDNEKSRRRRANKAKRVKAISNAALTKDRKVMFNEESRAEWLTGFQKRKLLRRKFGIAMQILKDKKVVKEKAREIRKLGQSNPEDAKNKSEEEGEGDDEEEDNEEDEDNDEENENDSEEDNRSVIYNDSQTTNMFGSAVSVEIDTNIADKLDPWQRSNFDTQSMSGESVRSSRSNGRPKEESGYQTEFLKAIKKAKQIIGQKKSKKKKDGNKWNNRSQGQNGNRGGGDGHGHGHGHGKGSKKSGHKSKRK